MAIEVPYTNKPEDISKLLQLIPDTGVPSNNVDADYLKSLGFEEDSGNQLIAILKKLDFIVENGQPSASWKSYVNSESRGLVLASAVKKAYENLFASYFCPYLEDDEVLLDYLKRNIQASPEEMEFMLQTFRHLTDPADFRDILCQVGNDKSAAPKKEEGGTTGVQVNPNLQLNIQVHIDPNTSDEKIETIFKNMRKYLLGKEG